MHLPNLVIYIPLGIIGLIRWVSWLVRQVPASFYRPVVNDHREPMSVVVPVYQEDPRYFRMAVESWLASGVDEVICVIDETDETSIDIAREYGVTVIITDVPGKRDALRRGWEAARTPLVALVDSDTVWERGAYDLLCMPFADPTVGAVAPRQNVLEPKTFWQHLNDMYLDYRYSHELPSQTAVGRAMSCVSGRTAVYRRSILTTVRDRFMNETFWGIRCLSGDDKRLTTLTIEEGYATVLQRSAQVWSTFPPNYRSFFKQRLRWSRNTWRSDLRALGSRWVWRHKFLAFWMLDKAVSSFTLLLAPAFMAYALVSREFAFAGILAGWWLFSRSAKLLAHLERRPLHFATMMPGYILISFVMAFVKITALLTVRQQKWLTRDVAVTGQGTEAVRTPGRKTQTEQEGTTAA